ncbi:MAG TPA: hypothetical protein VFV02_14760 [Acidimicrobiales bacterium]|nr:hypothetical protein [Acidimicrobiales bacterium]
MKETASDSRRRSALSTRHSAPAFVALFLAVALVSSAPPATASTRLNLDARDASSLTVPGANFFPESIAATPAGTLFVGSVVTGEILRFRPGSTTAETLVPAGVNAGTVGLFADIVRGVLGACAVDLSFQRPTALRAFDLRTGTLRATYEVPDRGVCADIALAHGDVYITDTTDPTAATRLPGRILRLTTPRPSQADGGTLTVWSADPLFTRPAPSAPTFPVAFQINGIAFDGLSTLYTTNLSTGELVGVRIRLDGSAAPASVIDLDRDLVVPDGIRMLDPTQLLVTELVGRLTLVNVHTGATTVVSESLDQPTSVVRVGGSLWVSEGQTLRLVLGQPPNLPFTVRRLSVPKLPPGPSWPE